jgi:hypothetical protein
VAPGVCKHGNFHNHLRGSVGELPAKVGPGRSLPGVSRTPSSAEPQVRPPSVSFFLVSSEFILGIFPRVSRSIEQTLTSMWASILVLSQDRLKPLT